MKTKHGVVHAGIALACKGMLFLLLFMPATSCRKNSTANNLPADLKQVAVKLDGTLVTGSLMSESDNEGLAVLYNNSKELLLIEKIKSSHLATPGEIKHAEIVCSSYGIIIRDTDNNKTWFYIQNDEKSKRKFSSLPVDENAFVSPILGSMLIHVSGS